MGERKKDIMGVDGADAVQGFGFQPSSLFLNVDGDAVEAGQSDIADRAAADHDEEQAERT